LYISGQVKKETTVNSYPNISLRQLGDQEVDIISIVKPITKFAVSVKNPKDIRMFLEKVVHIATSGRPGPVWLDIPLDVQGAMVEESQMPGYNRRKDIILVDKKVNLKISQAIRLLKNSKRPVLIAGHGIRIAGAQNILLRLIEKLKIPVLTTFNGFDLVSSDNPYFIGRIGTLGSRAGNFALQNSDLILCIGTRNNIRQISYNWKTFARSAKKVAVDIDQAELQKSTLRPDVAINCDVGYFLNELLKKRTISASQWSLWLKWCIERKDKYPVVLPEYKRSRLVNPYYFIQVLTELADSDNIMVAGNATACVVLFQAGIVKKNQRVFWNSGCASMGYDLPASIGACIANNRRSTICLAGDGSFQMNIQELQTMVQNKLPIKIFLLNNGGYSSIKQTQRNFFGLPYVGCDKNSGVSFPSFVKVARAYGVKTERITRHKDMAMKISKIIKSKQAILCDIILETDYEFAPRLSSKKLNDGRIISKPLEDMSPFLSRNEFMANMLVPVLPE
jgi:acetolactate synthase-1/2/3 large subunit